jgi:hypothetical protein
LGNRFLKFISEKAIDVARHAPEAEMTVLRKKRFKIVAVIIQILLAHSATAEPAFLWAHNPGKGYINGKTFSESSAYCKAKDGSLATKSQLIEANANGFSMCAYGWLEGGISGYVMSGTHAGCGKNGFNGGRKAEPSKQLGTYCVGPAVPAGANSVSLRAGQANYAVQEPGQISTDGRTVAMAAIDPNKYYHLSNSWLKESMVLTIDGQHRIAMAKKNAADPRQQWRFAAERSNTYRIFNKSLGSEKVLDSDRMKPMMRPMGKYTGQYWHLTPAKYRAYRISNEYQGKSRVLDSSPATGHPIFFEQASRDTLGTFWSYKAVEQTGTVQTTKTVQLTKTEETVVLVDGSVPLSGPQGIDAAQNVVIHGDIDDTPITTDTDIRIQSIDKNGCIWEKGEIYSCPHKFNKQWALQGGSDCSREGNRSRVLVGKFKLDSIDCETALGRVAYKNLDAAFFEIEKRFDGSGRLHDFVYEQIKIAITAPETANDRAVATWLLSGAVSLQQRILRQLVVEYEGWRLDPCAYELPEDLRNVSRKNFSNSYHCSGKSTNSTPGILANLMTPGIEWEFPTLAQFKQVATWRLASDEMMSLATLRSGYVPSIPAGGNAQEIEGLGTAKLSEHLARKLSGEKIEAKDVWTLIYPPLLINALFAEYAIKDPRVLVEVELPKLLGNKGGRSLLYSAYWDGVKDR